MTRQLISSGSTFEQEIGYSRPWSMAIGCSFRGQPASTTQPCRFRTVFSRQTEQCLENIVFAAAASPDPGATQLASQAGR